MIYSNWLKIFLLCLLIVSGWINYVDGQTDIPDKYLSSKELEKALKKFYAERNDAASDSSDSSQNEKEVVIDEELLNNIRSTLHKYQYQKTIYEKIRHQRVNDTLSSESMRSLIKNHGNTYENQMDSGKVSKKKPNRRRGSWESNNSTFRIGDIAAENNDNAKSQSGSANLSNSKDMNYKLEIAAEKAQLSQNTLKKLYKSDKEFFEIKENEWKKYSIVDFGSYKEAAQFREVPGIKDAFIVTTEDQNSVPPHKQKNQDVNVPDERNQKEREKLSENDSLEEEKGDIVYRVQIAAARIPLDESKLNSIYSGVKEVQLNRGNGWYRYSVGNCRTYYHARRLKKHIQVKGAFVVAYQDGERLNAYNMKTYPKTCPSLTITRDISEPPGRREKLCFTEPGNQFRYVREKNCTGQL